MTPSPAVARLGTDAQARAGPFRLVAIGASAGGPPALAAILKNLPADFSPAVVIVQHVDQRFAVGMAEWLQLASALPVTIARDGDRIEPGRVLLAGTGDHLTFLAPDRLGYTADPRGTAYRPSVDVFFESVVRHFRQRVIGVVLTGMGTDGARGLKALRDRHHHTIAQDQATSAVYGMPKAAAAAAVEILPLPKIGPRLVALASTGGRTA